MLFVPILILIHKIISNTAVSAEGCDTFSTRVQIDENTTKHEADYLLKKLLACVEQAGLDINGIYFNRVAEDVNYGLTGLMLAADKDLKAMATEFVDLGAALDVTNERGNTALMWAADSVEVAADLLAAGADVHVEDEDGWTALNWAEEEERKDIVKQLIRHGAETNQLDQMVSQNTVRTHGVNQRH